MGRNWFSVEWRMDMKFYFCSLLNSFLVFGLDLKREESWVDLGFEIWEGGEDRNKRIYFF